MDANERLLGVNICNSDSYATMDWTTYTASPLLHNYMKSSYLPLSYCNYLVGLVVQVLLLDYSNASCTKIRLKC